MVLPFLQAPMILTANQSAPVFTFFKDAARTSNITNWAIVDLPIASPSPTAEMVIALSHGTARTGGAVPRGDLTYGESAYTDSPAPEELILSTSTDVFSGTSPDDGQSYTMGHAQRIFKVPIPDFTNFVARFTFSSAGAVGLSAACFFMDFGSGGSTLNLSSTQYGGTLTMPTGGVTMVSSAENTTAPGVVGSLTPSSSTLRASVSYAQTFGISFRTMSAMKKLGPEYAASFSPAVTGPSSGFTVTSYGWDPA